MTVGFRCGLEGDSTYLSQISKYVFMEGEIEDMHFKRLVNKYS